MAGEQALGGKKPHDPVGGDRNPQGT